MASLATGAFGFYHGIHRWIRSKANYSGPPEDGSAWRRVAILSMLASIQLASIMFGLSIIQHNDVIFGIVIIAIGTLFVAPLAIKILRRKRIPAKPPIFELEDWFKGILTFSSVVAMAAGCIIIGIVSLEYGSLKAAIISLIIFCGLVIPSSIAGIRHILRQESLRPPALRFFRIATLIYALAAIVVMTFVTGFVLLLKNNPLLYWVGLFIATTYFSWILWKECKKAERKFDAILNP